MISRKSRLLKNCKIIVLQRYCFESFIFYVLQQHIKFIARSSFHFHVNCPAESPKHHWVFFLSLQLRWSLSAISTFIFFTSAFSSTAPSIDIKTFSLINRKMIDASHRRCLRWILYTQPWTSGTQPKLHQYRGQKINLACHQMALSFCLDRLNLDALWLRRTLSSMNINR